MVLDLPEFATVPLICRLLAAFLGSHEVIAKPPGRLAVVEFGRIRLVPP